MQIHFLKIELSKKKNKTKPVKANTFYKWSYVSMEYAL